MDAVLAAKGNQRGVNSQGGSSTGTGTQRSVPDSRSRYFPGGWRSERFRLCRCCTRQV